MRLFSKPNLALASLMFIIGCQSDPVQTQPTETIEPIAAILDLNPEQTSLQFQLEFTSNTTAVEIFVSTSDNSWDSLGVFNESPVTFIAEGPGRHGFIALALDQADNIQPMPNVAQTETVVPEPIIITDLQGEDFDITNAVLRYHMTMRWWEHGIGRNAIRPINNPQFVLPGEPGYPRDNATTTVAAVDIQNDYRAYGLNDIVDKEVVNDVIGEVYFAATY